MGRPSAQPTLDATPGRAMEEDIRAEHVRNLFAKSRVVVGSQLMLAAVIAGLLWSEDYRREGLAWWMAAMAVGGGLRLYAAQRYARASTQRSHWRTWERVGIASAALYGLLWAAAIGAFLDLDHRSSAILLTVVPMGIVGAASAANASVPAAYYSFDIPITATLAAVMIASGTAIGWTVAALAIPTSLIRTDISRRVRASTDRALRLGYENLALRQEAERANAAKTRFLAAASHDLRQPIHALGLSFSALVERVHAGTAAAPVDPGAGPGSDAPMAHLIGQVDTCIEAVRQMLEALLDISKLDAGVVQAERSAVDLAELMGRLEAELRPVAAQHGNRLRVRCARLPRLDSDAAMLECILRNLIGNALRYTRDGKVLVSARRRPGGARIAVWDTGIGIPADKQDEIFVEFRQLGNPQRDRSQGLGLGLAIVKRLAALLGHPIGVRSRPGRGSCFWIEVPALRTGAGFGVGAGLAAGGPPADASGERPAAAPPAGATVLVLDDDGAVREAMASLLAAWGQRVRTAGTAAEARAIAAREAPDLLVVDYRLPDATCAQAIEAIERERGQRLPVLVITGDTAPDRIQEAQSLGFPLLHKPVKPARLRAALRNLAVPGSGTAPGLAAARGRAQAGGGEGAGPTPRA